MQPFNKNIQKAINGAEKFNANSIQDNLQGRQSAFNTMANATQKGSYNYAIAQFNAMLNTKALPRNFSEDCQKVDIKLQSGNSKKKSDVLVFSGVTSGGGYDPCLKDKSEFTFGVMHAAYPNFSNSGSNDAQKETHLEKMFGNIFDALPKNSPLIITLPSSFYKGLDENDINKWNDKILSTLKTKAENKGIPLSSIIIVDTRGELKNEQALKEFNFTQGKDTLSIAQQLSKQGLTPFVMDNANSPHKVNSGSVKLMEQGIFARTPVLLKAGVDHYENEKTKLQSQSTSANPRNNQTNKVPTNTGSQVQNGIIADKIPRNSNTNQNNNTATLKNQPIISKENQANKVPTNTGSQVQNRITDEIPRTSNTNPNNNTKNPNNTATPNNNTENQNTVMNRAKALASTLLNLFQQSSKKQDIGLIGDALSDHAPVFGSFTKDGTEYKMGTWNLLRQQKEGDNKANPKNVAETDASYKERLSKQQDLILKNLTDKKMDFFAIQEVNDINLDDFKQQLKNKGYDIIYPKQPDNRTDAKHPKYNDNAIIYNSEKFKCSNAQEEVPSRNRNTAFCGTFTDKNNNKSVKFGSMHLNYNMKEDEISKNDNLKDVILAGDTNHNSKNNNKALQSLKSPDYCTHYFGSNYPSQQDGFISFDKNVQIKTEQGHGFEGTGKGNITYKDFSQNISKTPPTKSDPLTNSKPNAVVKHATVKDVTECLTGSGITQDKFKITEEKYNGEDAIRVSVDPKNYFNSIKALKAQYGDENVIIPNKKLEDLYGKIENAGDHAKTQLLEQWNKDLGMETKALSR